jgi:4-aminobutyrate aminotransferase
MDAKVQNLDILAPCYAHLTELVCERGEGIYLYDKAGDRYTDFTSGIAVTSTGHCHPTVVNAIRAQAEQLLFGQINCVIPDMTLRLAEQLAVLTPEGLDCLFFANSGAEAVENAVKLARMSQGRPNIITFQGGFHGRTALAMALTSSGTGYRAHYQPLPAGVFFAPFPYSYQYGQYGWDEDRTIDFCLDQLQLLLKGQTAPSETAAMLIEPVLGEGGYVPAPPRFLAELRRICDDNGILLILDEIQTGFGRTGEFWGHTPSGIVPDILVMAKGIASGLPLSAIAARRELMETWPPGTAGGTYSGGNAVVMAAALATLQVFRDEKLVENARAMGEHLTGRLYELQREFPVIGDVRGPGLMVATEMTEDGKPGSAVAAAVKNECLERKLLLLLCGSHGHVVRWIAPLIVTKEQIDEGVDIFADALRTVV